MPLTTDSVYPPPSDDQFKFPSRRSVVHSTKGIVACTQPLAAKCGLEILRAGGNAAVSGPGQAPCLHRRYIQTNLSRRTRPSLSV